MGENRITFTQVFNVIKQRLIWILLITLVATIFLFTFFKVTYTPTYTANASMYVYITSENSSSVSNNLASSLKYVHTLAIIIKSDTILDRVIDRLDLELTADQLRRGLLVESVNETEVLSISFTSSDALLSQSIVNAITEESPAEIERIIESASAKVVDNAKLPAGANPSNTFMKTLIGAVVAFALSCITFIAVFVLDTRIGTEEELSEQTSIPVFGSVPASEDNDAKKKKKSLPFLNSKKLAEKLQTQTHNPNTILNTSSSFILKESYNTIRTNMLFTTQDDTCPVIAITGATADVGKSTVCLNIAIAFSQLGKKVLLVDADLRNPTLHKLLDMHNGSGMSELLAGISKECVPSDTGIPNLSILTAGAVPPNPTELLFSQRFTKLMNLLKSHFDYIFIDTPPVNIVTDATMLAERISGYIFVARSMQSTTSQIEFAIKAIQQVNGKICGFVLNGVDAKVETYKSKYGRYGKYGKYGNYKRYETTNTEAANDEDIRISE